MMNSRSRLSVLANFLVIYGLGMFNARGPREIDGANFITVSQKLSSGQVVQRISQDDAITLYTTNAYTQMNGLMRAYFQGRKKFSKGKIDYETLSQGRGNQSQLWLKQIEIVDKWNYKMKRNHKNAILSNEDLWKIVKLMIKGLQRLDPVQSNQVLARADNVSISFWTMFTSNVQKSRNFPYHMHFDTVMSSGKVSDGRQMSMTMRMRKKIQEIMVEGIAAPSNGRRLRQIDRQIDRQQKVSQEALTVKEINKLFEEKLQIQEQTKIQERLRRKEAAATAGKTVFRDQLVDPSTQVYNYDEDQIDAVMEFHKRCEASKTELPVVYMIMPSQRDNSHGRPLGHRAVNKKQKEVLFLPGQQFHLLGYEDENDTAAHINSSVDDQEKQIDRIKVVGRQMRQSARKKGQKIIYLKEIEEGEFVRTKPVNLFTFDCSFNHGAYQQKAESLVNEIKRL